MKSPVGGVDVGSLYVPLVVPARKLKLPAAVLVLSEKVNAPESFSWHELMPSARMKTVVPMFGAMALVLPRTC